MPAETRVLLVEQLDALGAAPADAHVRRQILEESGAAVTLAIVEPPDAPWHSISEPRTQARRTHVVTEGAAGWRDLARLAEELDPQCVVWAAGTPGEPAAALGLRHAVRVWPTGCTPAAGALTPLAPALSQPHAPFAWTAVDLVPVRRGRLSLWDGPYVLAPTPLSGRAGKLAIEAFARSIRGRDAFDLVVLARPQPAFEDLADRLEVGMRVHFAGPAPRDAELAWLQSATAVVFGGSASVSAGLPLRALACGCPVLAAESGPLGLAEWLVAQQVAAGEAGDARALAHGLAAAMDGAVALEVLRERGRRLAAARTPAAVSAALGGWRWQGEAREDAA